MNTHGVVVRPCRTAVVVEPIEPRRLMAAGPSGLLGDVREAAGFRLVYDLDIPEAGGDFTADAVPYAVDDSAAAPASFDRVAYYLELTAADGTRQWAYASFQPLTVDARKIGVPTAASGAVFQTNLVGMTVASNVPGLVTGTDLSGGSVEFFPRAYDPTNANGVPNATDADYDAGDRTRTDLPAVGSMQVHNHDAGQTVFAYNDWAGAHPGEPSEVGIGNGPAGATDWTNVNTGHLWAARRLQVLVHPSPVSPPPPPPPVATLAIGKVLPLGDSITWGFSAGQPATGGYRSRLYSKLAAAHRSLSYVGSVRDNYSTYLRGVRQVAHEGHGGYRTDQVLGNLTGVAAGSTVSPNNGGHWLDGAAGRAALAPDVVLLHVGTNDFVQHRSVASAAANLDKIVARVTALRPAAKLFVASIVPIRDAAMNESVKAFNRQVRDAVVPKYKAMGRKVYFVDQYANFVDAAGATIKSLFSDYLHPSRAGYDKMGDAWAKAILDAR